MFKGVLIFQLKGIGRQKMALGHIVGGESWGLVLLETLSNFQSPNVKWCPTAPPKGGGGCPMFHTKNYFRGPKWPQNGPLLLGHTLGWSPHPQKIWTKLDHPFAPMPPSTPQTGPKFKKVLEFLVLTSNGDSISPLQSDPLYLDFSTCVHLSWFYDFFMYKTKKVY